MKRYFLILTLFVLGLICSKAFGQATDAPDPDACDTVTQKTICASGCDYTTITACYNAHTSGQGRNCHVTDTRKYVESFDNFEKSGASASQPFCISGNDDVDPGSGLQPIISPNNDVAGGNASARIRIGTSGGGQYVVIKGFEIRYCGSDCIKIHKGKVTVHRNWIHHADTQGILAPTILAVGNMDNVRITENLIEYNGTTGFCDIGAGDSPKHCHGIYLSASTGCYSLSNFTVSKNILQNNPGRGLLMQAQSCTNTGSGVQNSHILQNIFKNNASNLGINGGRLSGNLFAYNTSVATSLDVSTDQTEFSHILIGSNSGNVGTFIGNIYYSNDFAPATGQAYQPIRCNTTSCPPNGIWSRNLWNVGTETFRWNNANRTDFTTYWDGTLANDVDGVLQIDGTCPFVSCINDLHIPTTSAAKDIGEATCASASPDYYGNARPQGAACDAGIHEFTSTAPTRAITDIKWVAIADIANPESASAITTLTKGTEYGLCVKTSCSDGTSNCVRNVRHMLYDADKVFGEGQSLTNGNIPAALDISRIAYNFEQTGSNTMSTYVTDGSTSTTFYGNTTVLRGTGGQYKDSSDFYNTSGKIAVDANTMWHCTKETIWNEFPDGVAYNVALLKDKSNALSTEYPSTLSNEQVIIEANTSEDAPTATFDRFGNGAIAGCNGTSYMLAEGVNAPSLRVTYTVDPQLSVSNAVWECMEGCTAGQTALGASPATISPTFVEGNNTIKVTVTDSANQVVTTECRVNRRTLATVFGIIGGGSFNIGQ